MSSAPDRFDDGFDIREIAPGRLLCGNHYGDRGRNGFGLADVCGNVWEFVLDHFDPQGAHEEAYFVEKDPHPVSRGGNYFDVPGNARCAVRLGIHSPTYSDSRDGLRICLGRPVAGEPAK